MSEWHDYQVRVAEFFSRLGMRVEVDATVQGVRSNHAVDVLVLFERWGLVHRWLVECKAWNKPISKDRVEVLRTIAVDVGADRAFIVAEAGFQSGAHEAATLTNVTLTSLADLESAAQAELRHVELERLTLRAEALSLAMGDLVSGTRNGSVHMMRIRGDDKTYLSRLGNLSLIQRAIETERHRPRRRYVLSRAALPVEDEIVVLNGPDELISHCDALLADAEAWAGASLQRAQEEDERIDGKREDGGR